MNGSFEDPNVLDQNNPFIDIGVAVGIDGWQATFPGSVPDTLPIPDGVVLPPEFLGQLNAGVFLNVEVPIEENLVLPPIANADGAQLAYLLVNPDADGVNDTQVSIFQQTTAVYEPGKDYTFTIAIGNAVTFAADDTASLILSIGTVDSQGDFQPAEPGRTIFASQLVNNGSGLLTDFDVTLLAADIDPGLHGEQVAIRVLQDGGLGGGFNLDNARLAAVPEPASLALIAMGGLLLGRRRRQ
ncbi:MAG: PEP-CTERM sorting domain-containing protein [Planctomycetota bacterium]